MQVLGYEFRRRPLPGSWVKFLRFTKSDTAGEFHRVPSRHPMDRRLMPARDFLDESSMPDGCLRAHIRAVSEFASSIKSATEPNSETYGETKLGVKHVRCPGRKFMVFSVQKRTVEQPIYNRLVDSTLGCSYS